jgi:heat shock protein HslJ
MHRRALFAIAMAAAIAEGTVHAQAVDPALAAETWHVFEIEGVQATFQETLQFAEHRVTGRSACNRFTAGLQQSAGTLEIGQPVATRMFCQGRMDEEQRYFNALHAARSYEMTDGLLSLHGSDGHPVLKLKK